MKTYINGISVKEINGQYGSFFNISVNMEKLNEYANDKGYVNMVVSKRKEVSQYGETHSVVLNEWRPEGKTEKPKEKHSIDDISVEDIPF